MKQVTRFILMLAVTVILLVSGAAVAHASGTSLNRSSVVASTNADEPPINSENGPGTWLDSVPYGKSGNVVSEGASPEPIAGMNALSGQGNDVPLTKPVTVQVTSDAPGEITLTWEGADAPDGFLLMAMILETLEFEFASVPDSAARTGTVTGLTGGVSYVGVVVALKATEDGVDYLYEWGGPVTVQSSVTVESAEDRETLMAFYNAMGGANWADNTNWLSAALIGDWYGVTTDAEGNVTELNLRGNQLIGTIPHVLGDLTNLQVLVLWENQLSGEIPTELSILRT